MTFSLIGIDIGTTATKAILIDQNGTMLARYVRPHAMDRSAPNQAEQSPQDWMDSVLGALSHFSDCADLRGLIGIGLCSQVNTHVFADGAGRALRPAITWQDTRAAGEARTLDGQVTAKQKTEWFGGPVPIDASHALSRMAYIARTEPDLWAATRHVLLPKDYCAFQLTGALGSDPISAVGLVDSAGAYVQALLDLVPLAGERLPPLYEFQHVLGRVRSGLPCAGVPVVVGAMDAWGGMFGCGVASDGEAMYQSGTSEIPGIISSRVEPTPGVILFPPYQGIRMHAAPTQSGGASLAWLGHLLSRPPEVLSALAGASQLSKSSPIFLPHLSGERAPIWDAASRGVFARLDGNCDAGDLSFSVMEGVALSVRWAFEALARSADQPIGSARLGGGGAQSDIWCQLRADILGFPLERAAIPDGAALGAAILAGLGSGAFSELVPAVRQLVRFDRTFEPDNARKSLMDVRYGQFRALYEAMKPFNSRFDPE